MELYLSDKREELEKEKNKRDAVRTLMPQPKLFLRKN